MKQHERAKPNTAKLMNDMTNIFEYWNIFVTLRVQGRAASVKCANKPLLIRSGDNIQPNVGIAGLCLWQETVDIPYCENSRAANVISAIKSYCVEILSNQVERSS